MIVNLTARLNALSSAIETHLLHRHSAQTKTIGEQKYRAVAKTSIRLISHDRWNLRMPRHAIVVHLSSVQTQQIECAVFRRRTHQALVARTNTIARACAQWRESCAGRVSKATSGADLAIRPPHAHLKTMAHNGEKVVLGKYRRRLRARVSPSYPLMRI